MQPNPLPESVRISVQGDADGKISVHPDPAEVHVGTSVAWEFALFEAPFGKVVWEIYFSNTSAFPWKVRRVQVPSLHSPGPSHRGVLEAGEASDPGDHKYGVRFYEADTGRLIGDDDPRLLVLPRLERVPVLAGMK